jgi:acetyl-CoA carboxylase biotin carboxyl carrier protein
MRSAVEDLKDRIDELAELMDEFKLSQGELKGEGWRVAFKKRSAQPVATLASAPLHEVLDQEFSDAEEENAVPVIQGVPVNSPMTGIFYAASSPTSPPFVKEGEPVTAGQVIGLIEAMKVFNEITAPTSGTVTKVVAASGQLVNPGEALIYIG